MFILLFCIAFVCKIVVTCSGVGSECGANHADTALITVVNAEAISGGTSTANLATIQTTITEIAPASAPVATFGVRAAAISLGYLSDAVQFGKTLFLCLLFQPDDHVVHPTA